MLIQATCNESDAFSQTLKASSDGSVSIKEGNNDVEIKVDAPDGSSSKYIIHVYKPSASDCSLKDLLISSGTLNPKFGISEQHYTVFVDPLLECFTIAPIPLNSKSTLSIIAPETFKDSSPVKLDVPLSVGDTQVELLVTSANASSKKNYTVTIRKQKYSNLIQIDEKSITESLICSICKDIVFRPRKIVHASCKHVFCFTCLDLFKKTGIDALDSQDASTIQSISCPLCPDPTAFTNHPLLDSDVKLESALGSRIVQCPFTKFGCSQTTPASSILAHAKGCPAFPESCTDCNTPSIISQLEGGKHRDSCLHSCACGLRVPNTDKAFHATLCKPSATPPKASFPSLHEWMSKRVDKKKFPNAYTMESCNALVTPKLNAYISSLKAAYNVVCESRGTQCVLPDFSSLDEVIAVYATAASNSLDANKARGTPADDLVYVHLGLMIEEADISRSLFTIPTVEVGAKVNQNDEASESFMADEVDGLLLQLGVPPSATDAKKVKALEEEYHRLLGQGLSDQAAEVQGLHLWKVKAMNKNNTASGNGQEESTIDSQTALRNACNLYKDAVAIKPQGFESNLHFGRACFLLGRYDEAENALQCAVTLRPVSVTAKALLGMVMLSVPKIKSLGSDQVRQAIQFVEALADQFKIRQWKFATGKWSGDTKSGEPSSPIILDDYSFFNPTTFTIFESLSRGYMFFSKPTEAFKSYTEIISMLPDVISSINRKAVAFKRFTFYLCIVQVAMLCILHNLNKSPSPRHLATYKSIQNTLLTLADHSTADTDKLASISKTIQTEGLALRECVARYLVAFSPNKLANMVGLGQAQLDQYDRNGAFDKSGGKLGEAEASFRACLMATDDEEDSKRVAETKAVLENQGWWKDVQSEIDFQKKRDEENALNGAAKVDGKKGTIPATKGKAVPAAKQPGKAAAAKPAAAAVPEKKPAASKKPAEKKTAPVKPAAQTGKAPAKNQSEPKTAEPIKETPVPPPETPTNESSKTPKYMKAYLGLARCLLRRYQLLKDQKQTTPPELISEIKQTFQTAIKLSPTHHDTYIEFGQFLETQETAATACELYMAFPFADLDASSRSQDDLYLYGEINRILMKQKIFKEPKLLESLVAEGRAGGMKTLSKYLDALDQAGESKLLMQVFSGVNKKPIDDVRNVLWKVLSLGYITNCFFIGIAGACCVLQVQILDMKKEVTSYNKPSRPISTMELISVHLIHIWISLGIILWKLIMVQLTVSHHLLLWWLLQNAIITGRIHIVH